MPWQPPTRWEDISATLDTPLSDEAIRLLNERDRDLQEYIRLCNTQSGSKSVTVLGDSISVPLREFTMPRGDTGRVKITFEGNVTVNAGATPYTGSPTFLLAVSGQSGSYYEVISTPTINQISNVAGSASSPLKMNWLMTKPPIDTDFSSGNTVYSDILTSSGGSGVSFSVNALVTITPASRHV